VERVETHISWVFLTDRFAYKLKKPVAFNFLDFSTPQLREWACRQEVRLNRRLAAHAYLDVVPVTRTPLGRLQLGAEGRPLDWLVKMRRLPHSQTLQALIRDRRLSPSMLRCLAARLAEFYQQMPPLTLRIDDYRTRFEEHVRANNDELLRLQHGLDPHLVRRVHSAQHRTLRLAPELLDNRVRDGRVIEGHGDLRPEHIYLTPEPTIIDCIEFNEEYRRLDVLDELSFLSMECDLLNAPAVGESILQQYCLESGDHPPACLLLFYKAYRACVRAKVLALRSDQHPGSLRDRDLGAAHRYLDLADQYATQLGPPLLILVRGLPGTGKSTLASALAADLEADLQQTDNVRHQLFAGPEARCGAEDRYHPENKRLVYDTLLRRAEAALRQGVSAVLDGTFLAPSLVGESHALASRYDAEFMVVECRCPSDVAIARIARRRAGGDHASDATPEVYWNAYRSAAPLPHGISACRVDTTSAFLEMRRAVYHHLKQDGYYARILAAPHSLTPET
jgi:aminoglycoside phosphotransferase family enzyme/predicted kinase